MVLADFRFLLREQGLKLAFDGREVDCTASPDTLGQVLELDGVKTIHTRTATVLVSDFPAGPPATGKRVLLQAVWYRVKDSGYDQSRLLWNMSLEREAA